MLDKLTVNFKSDNDDLLRCKIILGLQRYPEDSQATPIETLNGIKKHNLQELYSYNWILQRILLIILLQVVNAVFFKLEII